MSPGTFFSVASVGTPVQDEEAEARAFGTHGMYLSPASALTLVPAAHEAVTGATHDIF